VNVGDRAIATRSENYQVAAAFMSGIAARAAIAELPNGNLKTALLAEWQEWRDWLDSQVPDPSDLDDWVR
jgi:hypothetical protein